MKASKSSWQLSDFGWNFQNIVSKVKKRRTWRLVESPALCASSYGTLHPILTPIPTTPLTREPHQVNRLKRWVLKFHHLSLIRFCSLQHDNYSFSTNQRRVRIKDFSRLQRTAVWIHEGNAGVHEVINEVCHDGFRFDNGQCYSPTVEPNTGSKGAWWAV